MERALNPQKKILILGATGKTGRRVVERLSRKNHPLRLGSRSAKPSFDWTDDSNWKTVLKDVDSVYITFQPDSAVSGAVDKIRSFIKIAKENKVNKLVLLSGRGEEEAQKCEQVIIDSGIDWTVIRSSWFNQNFSENYLLEPILSGIVVLPAGNIREPFIDADDIADVAVVALTEEGHSSKLYEVTGPRLLTFEEAIGEISKASGRDIIFEQIPLEEYAKMLREYNVPDDFVELIAYLFREVMDGRNELITNGIQSALGRKPKDFSDYVRETASTGVWSVVEKTTVY